MSEIERCPNCRGMKTVMGLGMLRKTCTSCMGVGHIKKEPVIQPKEDEPMLHEEKIESSPALAKKTPGKKKK